MIDKKTDAVGVGVHPPLVYGGGLVIGLLLQWIWPWPFLPIRLARRSGLLLVILSQLIGLPAFLLMQRAGTSVRPDQPTTALIVTGPFRYSRNPIYISLTLLYTGLATAANALWAILLLPVILLTIDRGMVAREERYLTQKFGEEYTRYKAHVRRWL